MRIAEATIRAAYRAYAENYGDRKNWDLSHHVEMWEWGRAGLRDGFFEDFQKVYEVLRGSWQVFRGAKDPWSAQKTFAKLRGMDKSLMDVRLSSLERKHLPAVKKCAEALSTIKVNKDGPSLVAISKFLHFWNPGLFVIVDRLIVWEYVFGHSWLWDELLNACGEVKEHLPPKIAKDPDGNHGSYGYYPAILWLGRQLLRDNPAIVPCFRDLILTHVPDGEAKINLLDLEAAAAEWLLIGLVELPPRGVEL